MVHRPFRPLVAAVPGQDPFVSSNGSFALVVRYQVTVSKENKMYIGGGLVGTVLVVLLVLFVLGRL